MGRTKDRINLVCLNMREASPETVAATMLGAGQTDYVVTASMLDDIYNKKILGFAADIPRIGRLDSPDGSAKAHSKLCGSTVSVDLKVENGAVTDFAHQVKACALGQASSSIMARHIIGETSENLRVLREQMHKMLKEGGPAPDGNWADLAVLEPVRDFKARHASTLLTFDAVVDALDMAEGLNADEKSAAAGSAA